MKYRKYKKRIMNKSIPKSLGTEEIVKTSAFTMSEPEAEHEDQNLILNAQQTEPRPIFTSTTSLSQDDISNDSIIVLDDNIPEKSSDFDKPADIVIDLDSYVEEKKKMKKSASNRCVNYECESGFNLREAPLFSLSFYRVKVKLFKVQEICEKCYEDALEYFENLMTSVINNQYLIEQDFPVRNDYVEIIDSDEETDITEDSKAQYLGEEATSVLYASFTGIVNDVMNKFKFDDQVDYALEKLQRKASQLTDSFTEVDEEIKSIQRRVDKVRYNLYTEFKPKMTQLDPVEIVDISGPNNNYVPAVPICSKQPTPQAERRSHRNITKPASYYELPEEGYPVEPPTSQVTDQQPTNQPIIFANPKKLSGFIMFARDRRPQVQLEHPNLSFGEKSRLVGSEWSSMPPETKKYWEEQALKYHFSADQYISTSIETQSDGGADIEVISSGVALPAVAASLPPKGDLQRPRPTIGAIYYAMKMSCFGAWTKVRLLEIEPTHEALLYKVRFEGKTKGISTSRVISGKHLAYSTPSPTRLEVGTRVIAVFVDESALNKDAFYTGVIAEPLSITNHYRYLVFFDDGYAQYVTHNKVLVVVESSRNVWEDIHPDSRHFIRKYLEKYPERPMVKLQAGQIVKTEWNGKWWIARVMKVEGSLVQMYFDADSRSEWIYRGSTRLGPLFLEMQAATARQERSVHIPKLNIGKKNLPYVEYTRSQADIDAMNAVAAATTATAIAATTTATTTAMISPSDSASASASVSDSDNVSVNAAPRAVARKSTSCSVSKVASPPRPFHTSSSLSPAYSPNMVPFLPSQGHQPQSKVVYFTPKSVSPPKLYSPHQCSPQCKDFVTLPLSALKGYNPLSKPLLCGWYRQIFRYRGGKKVVRYRAPCARSIRHMIELHQYLRITQSDMSVDMFDFDFWVHCLAEFVLDKTFRSKKDISNGVENVPIPCVNYVDNTLPDFCNYSTKREPMEGVSLNLDEDFLCACDCTDDCSDKTKCQCWQLTIREARTLNKRIPDELIGYTYKRLPEFVTTGIYECNSRCKCKATCLNRVVQHPLQLKLQLFKTANRGWGIRCLNDIPQGAFICIYAGSLLTDKMANEGGVNYGDEYLAELDYIEVVERQKDGYESDVTDVEDNDDKKDDDDEDFTLDSCDPQQDREYYCAVAQVTDSPIRTRSSKRTSIDSDASKKSSNTDQTSDKNSDKISDTPKEKEKFTVDEDGTVTISDDEETLREPSRFDPSLETTMNMNNLDLNESLSKFKSVRKMFGEDEVCYIMDAKNTGNIGRFLNHSCSPNVFVQNVFVDTHDLRFPWVAFFAMNYIRAGTELTWNYNYDVGSVPGKVIFCHCGSPECRGRLL